MKNKKIDKRKRYYLMLDTETCILDKSKKDKKGEIELQGNSLVYDIGFSVVDKMGKVYETGSYIISEIFFGEYEDKMQTAYYKNKLPQYFRDIANGSRVVKQWYQIRYIIRQLLEEYDIQTVVAHNALFDFKALQTTKEYLEESSMIPYIQWYDTMKMALSVIAKMPTYIRFCQENGYLTKNGRVQTKAEVLYKFISKNNDFKESHTGLEDTLIEKEILAYCFKQHKKMDKLLFNIK